MVALLLAVETMTISVFTDLSSLLEADQESVVVIGLQGVHCVVGVGVNFWCFLRRLGVELSQADCIPIIPLVSWWLSMITLCRLQWRIRPERCRWRVAGTCHGIIFHLLQQCLQQIQGGGMRLVLQVDHHRAVLW